jgi:hypothetical protein
MSHRHRIILSILFVCLCTLVSAQQALKAPSLILPVARFDLLPSTAYKLPAHALKPVSVCIAPKWSAEELPVFCKMEYKVSKNAALGFKFRLGSVDYVDWLEGKNRFTTFAPH